MINREEAWLVTEDLYHTTKRKALGGYVSKKKRHSWHRHFNSLLPKKTPDGQEAGKNLLACSQLLAGLEPPLPWGSAFGKALITLWSGTVSSKELCPTCLSVSNPKKKCPCWLTTVVEGPGETNKKTRKSTNTERKRTFQVNNLEDARACQYLGQCKSPGDTQVAA